MGVMNNNAKANVSNMRFAIGRLAEVEQSIELLKAEALVLKSQVHALVHSLETGASGPEAIAAVEPSTEQMSKEGYERVMDNALHRLDEIEKKI